MRDSDRGRHCVHQAVEVGGSGGGVSEELGVDLPRWENGAQAPEAQHAPQPGARGTDHCCWLRGCSRGVLGCESCGRSFIHRFRERSGGFARFASASAEARDAVEVG